MKEKKQTYTILCHNIDDKGKYTIAPREVTGSVIGFFGIHKEESLFHTTHIQSGLRICCGKNQSIQHRVVDHLIENYTDVFSCSTGNDVEKKLTSTDRNNLRLWLREIETQEVWVEPPQRE